MPCGSKPVYYKLSCSVSHYSKSSLAQAHEARLGVRAQDGSLNPLNCSFIQLSRQSALYCEQKFFLSIYILMTDKKSCREFHDAKYSRHHERHCEEVAPFQFVECHPSYVMFFTWEYFSTTAPNLASATPSSADRPHSGNLHQGFKIVVCYNLSTSFRATAAARRVHHFDFILHRPVQH